MEAVKLRRAKKTFNVITAAFIDQLLALFPEDRTLAFFKGEVQKFAANVADAHVPAVKFFQTMNVETKFSNPDGTKSVVGDLVVAADSKLFEEDCGAVIPEIEALGLRDKWPRLNAADRANAWDYLKRMAKTSALVVVAMGMNDPEVQARVQQLVSEKK